MGPTSDFMAKVPVGDFRKSWETMGNGNEVLEKFSLQFKKLEDAVTAVIDFLGSTRSTLGQIPGTSRPNHIFFGIPPSVKLGLSSRLFSPSSPERNICCFPSTLG